MIALAEKYRRAEEDLARAHGEFSLFMLVERPDIPGLWDVVVAAPWLGEERKDYQLIVDGLLPYLDQTDWRAFARIALVQPDGEFARTINRRVPAHHEIKEVSLGQIGGPTSATPSSSRPTLTPPRQRNCKPLPPSGHRWNGNERGLAANFAGFSRTDTG